MGHTLKPFARARLLIPTLATLAVLGAFSGCEKKTEDGSLMVFHTYLRDDAKTLDPANVYDTMSQEVAPHIHETLYQYAYLSDTYKVVPLLASDLPKIAEDRLTVTIPIRPGIHFQDDPCFKESGGKGRELKAQDFVFAFKRLALPSVQSQGWWIFDKKIAGLNEFHDRLAKATPSEAAKIFNEPVAGLKALDDNTLQLKLVRPYPQLNYVLSMTFSAPVPPEAVTVYGDENGNIADHPVGTGPFVLKKWERGYRITMDRNPKYHPEFYPIEGSLEYRKEGLLADAGKPLPFLDRVQIDIVNESQPAWKAFMKGDYDRTVIPQENFKEAITNQTNLTPTLAARGIRLVISPSSVFYYISFNMRDRIVGTNRYLRQALSSAIDRDKWAELFFNGRGKKMVTALPPGTPDRPRDAKLKYDLNLARARELLKKAGYPEGRGLPTLNFDMRGADALNRQMGEHFAKQFEQIGVKLNVIYNTFPAYLEKSRSGNLQISYGGWSMDYPDAENLYQLLYGPNHSPGANESNFNDARMNALYEKMATMASGPARAALVAKMDNILQEEVPWAMGFYLQDYSLSQPWLVNHRPSDLILNKTKYLRINRDAKRRYLEVR